MGSHDGTGDDKPVCLPFLSSFLTCQEVVLPSAAARQVQKFIGGFKLASGSRKGPLWGGGGGVSIFLGFKTKQNKTRSRKALQLAWLEEGAALFSFETTVPSLKAPSDAPLCTLPPLRCTLGQLLHPAGLRCSERIYPSLASFELAPRW